MDNAIETFQTSANLDETEISANMKKIVITVMISMQLAARAWNELASNKELLAGLSAPPQRRPGG